MTLDRITFTHRIEKVNNDCDSAFERIDSDGVLRDDLGKFSNSKFIQMDTNHEMNLNEMQFYLNGYKP